MQPLSSLHRFDVDQYYRLAEIGVLTRNERVELIDGIVVDMDPQTPLHAGTLMRLTSLMYGAGAHDRVQVSIHSPLRLDRFNEPEPDLMLLHRRDDDYGGSHPDAHDVLLLVEVADSSLAYDQGAKLALYARHRVPEVWIVDLAGRTVEICRTPGPQGYAERQRVDAGTIHPTLLPELAVDLGALFQ